ncbi:uncharacterized protein LOC113332308 [Papaver somniferum]|uniref:uncharacterized protein LOC113332308 n=1 Tax=Papaver somniferum TaxID=3469 RepID=UPI000E6FCAC6|nr:uncharacterized protein LOC113332308 [Papaver somniferum]
MWWLYPGDIGKRVILPPSYTGSPRDMHQRYYDARALVQKYGKPDFFITMTCKPKWEEIQKELKPWQHAHDMPDLTTRVFHSKFEELKTVLFTKGVLGKVVAHVHVIECQKRGLPHAHILIILDERDKLCSPDDYDTVVRAEIPDPDIEPGLRRDDGREVTFDNGKVVNNSWVVPYNPWLLKKYDCHINVEICSSVKSVKYLYKYVWKGVDCVCMEVSSEKGVEDEIKQFVDAHWIFPQEALWRICRYQMNKISPPVVSLQIHLKDHQKTLLPEGRTVRDVLQRERASRTKLTEYFKKNAEDEFARTLLYKEFLEHYVWDQSLMQWNRRRRNNRVIGRVDVVSTRTDNYYLRLLLNHVRGPTSYEDLLKVGSVTFSTYREVAHHLGLLESDTAMRDTLLEATQVQMPSSLRRLFCTILALWNPTGVRELWDEFLPHLIEDHLRSNT